MSLVFSPGSLSVTFIVIVWITGCVNSRPADKSSDGRLDGTIMVDQKMAGSLQLADYLRRVPGLLVQGAGENTQIKIRGVSSIYMGTDPLYVINSQIVGTNYSDVDNLINMRNIDHIRVLKGSDAAIYGVRGANGVIIITTRD